MGSVGWESPWAGMAEELQTLRWHGIGITHTDSLGWDDRDGNHTPHQDSVGWESRTQALGWDEADGNHTQALGWDETDGNHMHTWIGWDGNHTYSHGMG